jgi:serine/threonine protein kinase
MIIFLCSHCGAQLAVMPEQAGTRVMCSECGKPVDAPSPDDGAGAADAPLPADPGSGEVARPERELDYLSPPEGPDELGRLADYRVLKVLGQGGMGVVFLAEDVGLQRPVALKVMKRKQAADPVNRARFLREARAAANIEHDHIVTIYRVGEDRGIPFLAMKLLVGESLEDRITREGKLPPEEIIRIGQEIAQGLAAAHERGLIHRDIKPANIWLEEGKGRVKIVDFGLVQTRDDDAHLTAETYLVGTPMFMSPEQAEGDREVDARSDLFSLGSVLYRSSTGELPFKGKKTIQVLSALATKRPAPPIELNPEMPPALSELIMKLLEKNPDKRPRNAQEVVELLEEVRNAPEGFEEVEEELEEVEQPEPEPEEPERKPVRRPPRRARRSSSRAKEIAEERLQRRVIGFGIFAAILVFGLLAYLVISKMLKKKDEEAPPPAVGSLRLKPEAPARISSAPRSRFGLDRVTAS